MAVIKVINRLFSTLFTSRLTAWVRYEWLKTLVTQVGNYWLADRL